MPITPMMKKYLELKEQYKDCLLFYRLGDFYEMFFDDAITTTRELGIALTGRDCGLPERAPMCGVPHHAATTYIKRLVDKGYSVAVCEQLTPAVKGKMVERDVVKIITPGTYNDETFLDSTRNNFVAAVYMMPKFKTSAVSWADLTTGQFYAMETGGEYNQIVDILAMVNPREIISTTEFRAQQKREQFIILPVAKDFYDYSFTHDTALETIKRHFKIQSTKVFDIPDKNPIINASGALMEYLVHTQKQSLPNMQKIIVVRNNEYLVMDKTCRDHLEITHQFRDPSSKAGSLLHTIDQTKTGMGARLLATVLTRPLIDIARINQRLDAVESFINNTATMKDIRETLGKIADMQRLTGKIATKEILPREMLALSRSLESIETLKKQLTNFDKGLLKSIRETLTPIDDIANLIATAIDENPPSKMDDGGYIKIGYNSELDELRNAQNMGKVWLSKLEEQEKRECDIKELKIAYNRVAGYYFEVPKRLAERVPYRMTRHGGTLNSERYITEELKQLEEKIVNAQTLALGLEQKILSDIRTTLTNYISQLTTNGEQIAILDVMTSFANIAIANNYVRPKLNQDGELVIKSARHPVLESVIGTTNFIPNDCHLHQPETTTKIITGPNMAGKSTYMKTIALNVIMAHAGSFVPATSANIPIMDRIFTRIGASDNLLGGESTFMTEMNEVATILNNATSKSLLLLDEIGRGTGTREGMALASSILSYVVTQLGSFTLFATHFHELVNLAKTHPQIVNYKATVDQSGSDIIFLHKIVAGIEQNSFGIDVAKLAGLPTTVIENANKLYEKEIKF